MTSHMDSPCVAIVGGGIIGLSTAVRLSRTLPDVRVTVIADKFTPDTTGDGAAGLCLPYLLGKDIEKQNSWFKETFNFIRTFYVSSISESVGVSLLGGYLLCPTLEAQQNVSWNDTVYGFRHMAAEELDIYEAKYGVSFMTFVTECSKFLPFLTEQLKRLGVQIENRKVEQLQELADDFDVVVNCTGLFSKYLTNDELIHPVRGQVLRVEAPWIKTFVLTGDHYIIPNTNTTVLGGTHQNDDWNVSVDPDDRDFILHRCYQLVPSLRKAKIVQEWVGLRPGRESVRLEKEELKIGQKIINVVHNYGHGGAGVSIFWGCAREVVEMVAQILQFLLALDRNTMPSLLHELWDFPENRRIFDQSFGLGIHHRDFVTPSILHGFYARPRRELMRGGVSSGTSEVRSNADSFQVLLDVNQFSPDEISVKTVDNYVVIHGKHEEKADEHGFVSREFSRRYLIPDGVDPQDVISSLSRDGFLAIEAPRRLPDLPKGNERIVPVVKSDHTIKSAAAVNNANDETN